METVSRSYLLVPRPDLSSPLVEVVDWRLRAHDGVKIVGLRGQSPFHPLPRGAQIRQVSPGEPLEPCLATVAEGCADFVYRCDPERRLEDRVLDALRVWQAALNAGIEPEAVHFVHPSSPTAPDEFMIATELLSRGIFERLAQ